MDYRQDAPFCIQVEMTTGCNLQCTFCGINGFQEKPNSKFNFMSLETAEKLASQIAEANWNSRIEFAMHGEPTMNPNWPEIIAIFRKHLPKHQIMMTSNGGGLLVGGDPNVNMNKFFRAGGDILAVDMYESYKISDKIRAKTDILELECANLYTYPDEKDGNPHRRVKNKFVTLVHDISSSDKGTHSTLQNHAGSASELDYSKRNKPCVKPFRELGVNSDGSIDICCNDWLGEMTVDNIHNSSIYDIWHSDVFYAMRRMLMGGERLYRPCLGCSDMGYRVGLLPDKLGKVTLPLMDEWDKEIVEEVLAKGPTRKPHGKVEKRLENIIFKTGDL